MSLYFANTKEALDHLSSITNSKIIIEDRKNASLPNEDIDKLLFYFQEALSYSKNIPVAIAYGIGFFQKHPELINSIDMNKCIEAENLAVKLYEILNDIEAELEEERGQVRYET